MSLRRIVIVGAGQGGLQAAMSLRQEGFAGEITLIGAEPGLPYQRPPLSKAYLKTGEAEKLVLRPQGFFEKNAITLVTPARVEEIDRAKGEVRTAEARFAYDHLILATGAQNNRPPIPGLAQALDLRTLEDAAGLRAALEGARRVAVIGGGFIGLEFAAVACGLGHEVIVAEAAERLMARAVSPEIAERFRRIHEDMGTDLRLGAAVAGVLDTGIALADGTEIPADLVLVATGVRPDTSLAEGAGLAVENGIRVDELLTTSDPNISALGDCASFPDPKSGARIRLESVQAATDHARLIARRLCGVSEAPYAAVPWFWSDQGAFKLQIAGLAAPSDDSVPVGRSAVYRFAGDTLTAVETINDAKTHMEARRLLAADTPPSRDILETRGYELVKA